MGSKLTQRESKTLYIVRFFAILSVISAHVVYQMSDESAVEALHAGIWSLYGHIGVICFLVIGGFLYSPDSISGIDYAAKKFKGLILPWLICAFSTYCLTVICGAGWSVRKMIYWILGSGSWYYYISVYLICLIGFRYVYRNTWMLWACVCGNVLSLLLTEKGILVLKAGFITDYLNVFNWIGFFAVGILAKKHWHWMKDRKRFAWFAVPVCAGCGWYLNHNRTFTYFHLAGALFELAGCVCLILLCSALVHTKLADAMIFVGKNTYFIYLVHMQVVQKFCGLMPDGILFDMIRPFAGLAIMVCLLRVCSIIAEKIPALRPLVTMTGIRQ